MSDKVTTIIRKPFPYQLLVLPCVIISHVSKPKKGTLLTQKQSAIPPGLDWRKQYGWHFFAMMSSEYLRIHTFGFYSGQAW